MKKLYVLRYNGPCDNISIAVCTSKKAAIALQSEAPRPDHWDIVEVTPNAFFEQP